MDLHRSVKPAITGRANTGFPRSYADQFLARTITRPAGRRIGEDFARLRALRVLHRDLPDLCGAGRRARFAAWPHLPDQGDAGAFARGDARSGQAYRPLPVLP